MTTILVGFQDLDRWELEAAGLTRKWYIESIPPLASDRVPRTTSMGRPYFGPGVIPRSTPTLMSPEFDTPLLPVDNWVRDVYVHQPEPRE